MSYAAYGSYSLDTFNSGVGNIFRSKPVGAPAISPVVSTVARRYGAVKSGETVPVRDIPVTIKIVASSRSDLNARLDALKKALWLRGQQLVIYEDLRYFSNVDCVAAEAVLSGAANISACVVNMTFRTYDVMAYAAASSSYDTGTVVLTLASGVWNFPATAVVGGGTVESYPLIRLTNQTSTGATTLTTARNSGTSYTTLPVNATSFSASVGDQLKLVSGGNSQTVTVATSFSVGATTITVSSFTANATYGIGSTVTKQTQWTAISVTQASDSQTVSANSTATVPLPLNNADYVDIQCDPATGFSIMTNGNGKLSDPVGVFPTLPPDSTNFNITVTSVSAVSADALFSWTARYL
jgi:hypothetical protein